MMSRPALVHIWVFFFFALGFGTFPIRGSPFKISSHALIADSSKSTASLGRFCQTVAADPNSRIDLRDGNSFFKLA